MTRVAGMAAGLALIAGTALLVPSRRPVRLEIGAFDGPLLSGAWSRSVRENLDPPAAEDDVLTFYRRAAPPTSGFRLPINPSGRVSLALRGITSVRSEVGVFVSGQAAGKVLLTRGPWRAHTVEFPPSLAGGGLDVSLALRPLPLVRGAHVDNPQLLLDYVEVTAENGWRLSWPAIAALVIAVAAVVLFVGTMGLPPSIVWGVGTAFGAAVVVLARVAPVAATLAAPRLVPVALAAGLVARFLLARVGGTSPRERAALAALVAAGTLAHGSLVFFPNHNPPDIDIHVRRSLDLRGVPFEYQALLRYGSQLPTASQDMGQATAALGERTLIPYSPLPYFFYYAAHKGGLDLYWAMTAFNAALAMLAAVVLWLSAARVWDREAAWMAAAFYALDLAVWHHLGRSHAPAVFGGALGTMALAYLLGRASEIATRREIVGAGLVLGVAVLGYSSLVVLIGFFGLVLLTLLLVDARGLSTEARRGLALALIVGGMVAGALFYFHYVPGLLGGAASVEAEPDAFPGKTFFIFHNESRQSLRLWILGFWMPLGLGLLCAPLAWVRAPRWARPVLTSWLAAWVLVMVFKEPFLFPKLLRWAKEDQFVSPLLCLCAGAALAAVPRRTLRWGLAGLLLAGALYLEANDFAHHANSLLL
jgi:hypothetical protein